MRDTDGDPGGNGTPGRGRPALYRPDAGTDPRRAGGAGFAADGRLLALNSYENRVWQVGIEDGPPLVAKFYRPGRWSDAAIAPSSPNWRS